MRNLFLWFAFTLINISVTAKECPGYYVTNNSDTIECVIDIIRNPFHKGVYRLNDISEKVRVIDEEGVKNFKPHEIAGFVLVTPEGETCKFISMPTDEIYFYREIIIGKISLYEKYMTHPYDKGQLTELTLYKDNQYTKIGFMSARRKKLVSPIFEDNSRISAKWEASNFNYNLLKELINEYNGAYSEK